MKPSTWTPWQRAVGLRLVLLGVAWLLWLAMVAFVLVFHLSFLNNGGSGPGLPPPRPLTMYEADHHFAISMLVALALFLLVETSSVIWRAVVHSSRIGVGAMVVAGTGCIAPLLFAFTPIGFYFLPLAALGVVLALPIGQSEVNATNGYLAAPPGWYADPMLVQSWRFWDGRSWTEWTA